MKAILFIALAVLSTISPCLSDDSQISLQWKIPAELEKILLDKTGAKSVRVITKVAYRYTEKFDVLAISAELENHRDIKIGIQEGIMHVEVAFIKNKNGQIDLYTMEGPIGNILMNQEIDLSEGFIKFK